MDKYTRTKIVSCTKLQWYTHSTTRNSNSEYAKSKFQLSAGYVIEPKKERR